MKRSEFLASLSTLFILPKLSLDKEKSSVIKHAKKDGFYLFKCSCGMSCFLRIPKVPKGRKYFDTLQCKIYTSPEQYVPYCNKTTTIMYDEFGNVTIEQI